MSRRPRRGRGRAPRTADPPTAARRCDQAPGDVWAVLVCLQGDSSSRTRPFVSIANSSVRIPPTTAAAANTANTYAMPGPATIQPTKSGPIADPALSHALPNPVPIARTRVG